MKRQGTVEEIRWRDWHQVKLWSFKLEGDTTWYGTGKHRPEFEEGVALEFEEANGTVKMGSMKIVDAEPTPAPVESLIETQSVGTNSFVSAGPTAWQIARRDATDLVVAALHTDALPWAKNTAKNKKLDLLIGYINEVATKLVEDENGRSQ